jgi:hypothetical protein
MTARQRWLRLLSPSLLLLALVAPASAADPDYARFFGEYEGVAISGGSGKTDTRDIRARIGPTSKGFTVNWLMTIHRASGTDKRVEYTMTFLPTKRDSVYSAAMSLDAFGNAVPLDPMKGDPYVWARIEGPTLTIYALTVTDHGGYDLQVFDRKLVPGGGMDLKYSRIVDGQVQRTVTGRLKKVR